MNDAPHHAGCPCAADLAELRQRVADLEAAHGNRLDGHDQQIANLGADLREVRRTVNRLSESMDRVLDASTAQGLTLEQQVQELKRQAQESKRQGDMTERVLSLLEQLVRQQTPSVEVTHG